MILIIIYTIISFLLDGLISNYMPVDINNLSYLTTIYSVISIIIIYNYFENEQKYIKIITILAFFFDIIYTNTFPLNIIIFITIYLIEKVLNYYIPNNIFTINIKTLLGITIYYSLSYIILLLVHYNKYPISILYITLYKNIIMTIIYTTISYIIIKKLYNKYYDKKIK